MKKLILSLSLFSLAVFSNAAMLQAYDPVNKVNRDVICFSDGTLAASTGNTTTGVSDNGNSSVAAALWAASANTPADPGYIKVSPTASSFIHLTITANTGSYFHTILAAPGAGLKYRIINFRYGVSGGCTGTITALCSLASGSTDLQGTMAVPYFPNAVSANPGGWAGVTVDKNHTFLTTNYNEALNWHWNGTFTGTNCNTVVDVEYRIIQ